MLGLHRQHLALGLERGDLLLVATDLLGQLLSKHPPEENRPSPTPLSKDQESVVQPSADDQELLVKAGSW